jgi:two-component system response regulator TctD
MRLLLAEDEHSLGEWLCKALAQIGCKVEWVDDGRLVEPALSQNDFDAVVLDLGLPGRTGAEVLKRLRVQDKRLPVLILTARSSLADKVESLNAGADDFLVKPFALAELEARLMALVRRARGNEFPRFAIGALQFDAISKQFKINDEVLALSPREYTLLKILIQRVGEPISRGQILDRIFSDEEDVQSSAVDVLVHRLRKRLEVSGIQVKTYRGLGYVLEANEET